MRRNWFSRQDDGVCLEFIQVILTTTNAIDSAHLLQRAAAAIAATYLRRPVASECMRPLRKCSGAHNVVST